MFPSAYQFAAFPPLLQGLCACLPLSLCCMNTRLCRSGQGLNEAAGLEADRNRKTAVGSHKNRQILPHDSDKQDRPQLRDINVTPKSNSQG